MKPSLSSTAALFPRPARTCAVLVLLCAVGVASAEDWPRFRGPHGDGVSEETGLAKSWTAEGPQELWRVPLGEGYSAISVAGERVFTLLGRGEDELAVALSAKDGSTVWEVRIGPKWLDRFGNGPRSTPTVDGDTVYVLGSRGHLAALAVADGKPRWRHDLRADYDAKPPQWGVATSPVVEGQSLLVNVGGDAASIVAFDKATGEEIWRTASARAAYATPLAITVGDRRQVVFFDAAGLVAVAPEDGSRLWSHKWKTDWDVNAAMPLFVPPDRIFVSSGYGKGAAMLRVVPGEGKTAVEELWRSREMKNRFSSSVLYRGAIFGFDERILKCIDPATGETRWQKRDFGHGSLIAAAGRLIVLGDAGQLALVEAETEQYVERGKLQVFRGKTWTMPTLAGGTLYLRDEKELVALRVSG